MATPDQKKKLLKAKIAVALHDELGRVPKKEEIDKLFLLARVMYKAILGLHYKWQEQKKTGQLVAGAKLGMRPEYCRGQLAKPVDAHTRPSCHNGGKL
jgi:hypothetical protein